MARTRTFGGHVTQTTTAGRSTAGISELDAEHRLEKAIREWAGVPTEIPPTSRGVRTREAILDAARRVFEERGFTDARISDFVAAAEVSHGTFYNYFDNKREVFAALITESVSSQLIATRVPPDYAADPVARIEYTVRRYAELYVARGRMSVVINQVSSLDEDFRQVRQLIRQEFRDRVERGIRRQQARGIADADVDPAIAADVIVSMISGYCLQHFGLEGERDIEPAVYTLTRFWTRSLGITTAERTGRAATG
jgi:AcrR family transcriptional regulator